MGLLDSIRFYKYVHMRICFYHFRVVGVTDSHFPSHARRITLMSSDATVLYLIWIINHASY